jgi:hypothetical protein
MGGGGRGLTEVRPCGHSGGENLTTGWGKDGYDDGEPYQGWQLAARQRMTPVSEGNGTRRWCLVLGGSGHG